MDDRNGNSVSQVAHSAAKYHGRSSSAGLQLIRIGPPLLAASAVLEGRNDIGGPVRQNWSILLSGVNLKDDLPISLLCWKRSKQDFFSAAGWQQD